MEIKQICVIGAGISGLVVAKTFLQEGYDVTVFEKQTELGGVWEKSRTYPGLTTQNNRDTYCFSHYPMPASYPEWPTAKDMQNYLQSYAQHFGVTEKIRFQAEVTNVSRTTEEQPKWLVTVKLKDVIQGEAQVESYKFDFVVVCNGTFSSPNVPDLLGKEEFITSGGKVLHSTEFNNVSMIEGKRVAVVGCGKSACDIVTIAATTAKESTLIFRQALWKLPRFFFGLVNIKYVLLTRFAEAWFPYRYMGRAERMLHTFGKPLVWAFWRANEMLLRLQFGLDSCGMLPEHQIDQLECSVSVAPANFFDYIRAGKIRAIKTSVAKFIAGGVELANGQQISADVVIFGTGFRQDIPFLSEKYRRMLINEEGNFQLYRYLIHPEIPQMGFVGYNNGLYTALSSEVGACWLLEYVKGNLSLPSTQQMYQEIATELDWMKNHFLNVVAGATCISTFCLRHIEQLLDDMGAKNADFSWKRILEVMKPLKSSAYAQRLYNRQSVNTSIISQPQNSLKKA